MNRLRRHIVNALTIAFVACPAIAASAAGSESQAVPASAGDAPARNAAVSLHEVLDTEWQWRMAQFPEKATDNGDHRYDDRLTDRSAAAIALRRQHHRQFLDAVQP